MGKPRDVLLLTGPYLESGYPTIAEYAERSNWRLEIAERYSSFAAAWPGEPPMRWIWPEDAHGRSGRKALAEWRARQR